MNKYYIRKNSDLGLCIRFEEIKSIHDGKSFRISDLTFLDWYGFIVSPDGTGWAHDDGRSENFKKSMESSLGNYIYEFETDEEALLFYEVMDT